MDAQSIPEGLENSFHERITNVRGNKSKVKYEKSDFPDLHRSNVTITSFSKTLKRERSARLEFYIAHICKTHFQNTTNRMERGCCGFQAKHTIAHDA